ARGKFLPSISIEGRYSRAGGGRNIEFPVADLMNPVYSAINATRMQAGQQPFDFPILENEVIPFLRKEEHETKIRATQVIFQPALFYNQKIKSDLKSMREYDVSIYKRQLISEIKTAYLNYLKLEQAKRLYVSTMELLKENLRVSAKLVENGKATKEIIYRAQTELSKIEQELEDAQANSTQAQYYFNHLRNRPLQDTIRIEENLSLLDPGNEDADAYIQSSLANREELKQLKETIEVARHAKGAAGSAFLPGILVVGDYGYQGEEYNLNPDYDYWMVSGILQWNLFNGFQDHSKRQQAKMDEEKANLVLQETEKLLTMQVQKSYDNLQVAAKARITSEERLKAARESFKIINKKYNEGLVSQIEFIDAHNSLISAEIGQIIHKYDYYICAAELERVAALWIFE
ncbi:MAG TPA: TolC family protein, partial [Caldithrix sp.]|nr:TolC family protein [Caldithrix sp.]